MVKPTQPKGIKPKAEVPEMPVIESGGGGGGLLSGQKLIIVNTVVTAVICILFLGGNYFIVNGVISSKLAHLNEIIATQGEASEEEGEEGEKPEKGIILDLGEFILNLSDPSAKRYLKVNVALELSKTPDDPGSEEAPSGGGGHGGGHGAKPPDPLELIEQEMKQYKPAIRDAIISVLSSKTTEELSSLAGKELAKEQIKEAIDPIFSGEREVMRVSFGTFIIQ
ncbi:MAG: hypothetical protein A2Y25_00400 [Candidatus Melainabacteria bacterium GWF2_37_15]|nr:MAG: hypothetical protein A2Y25_00400 [Candidatus Melainabacteria bacterium GWF2_37_15]